MPGAAARPIAWVVSPNEADAELAARLLADADIGARASLGLGDVARELDEGVGCLVIVEEALVEPELGALREALARLPPWSDLPLVLVSRDVGALGSAAASAFS